MGLEEIYRLSGVDPWFLVQIEDIIKTENALKTISLEDLDETYMRRLKRKGFSDGRLAILLGVEGRSSKSIASQVEYKTGL